MKPLFIKNIPIDETRISFIEQVITRILRRVPKKTHAIMSPYPVSNAVISEEVKGSILYYMFPCKGKITKGAINIGKKPKQEVFVDFRIRGKEKGSAKSFLLPKKKNLLELNFDIEEFDQLIISIDYEAKKEIDNLTEVWAAFLWVPTVEDGEVRRYLINELDKNEIDNNIIVRREQQLCQLE